MKFERSFDESSPPRIRKFTHTASFKSVKQTAALDVAIPLSENQDIDELVAHLLSVNKILPPFRKEIDEALRSFIDEETRKYENEIGDAIIDDFLQKSDDEDIDVSEWERIFSSHGSQMGASESLSFGERFQFVMRNSSHERIETIISMERKMADEMSALVRARDFELDRLMRRCETAIDDAVASSGENAQNNAHQLSRMNEHIRDVSNNYAQQIQALADRQRFEYRKLITSLFETDQFPAGSFDDSLGPIETNVKKSTSAFANLYSAKSASNNHLEESFTIYLGAQLKTMHNARLMTRCSLSDLCRPDDDACEPGTLDTRRLHMNLSLYRRGLSGLVLLVGKDPNFHIHNRTEFSRICEQSTELHFDSLPRQIKDIAIAIREANRDRCKDGHHAVRDDESLQVGDVYITKHSNLASFQTIFHLVVDDAVDTEEISSRHPCINGLRNVIRMSARCGISTFSIPLLLVEKTNEKMTVTWCLKRAELVFKCVKGFMMEACGGSSTAGGGPTEAVHYNVNFVLPEQLSNSVYSQIVEMFPAIFHLVPSVSM